MPAVPPPRRRVILRQQVGIVLLYNSFELCPPRAPTPSDVRSEIR
jgi:hypothetical protein